VRGKSKWKKPQRNTNWGGTKTCLDSQPSKLGVWGGWGVGGGGGGGGCVGGGGVFWGGGGGLGGGGGRRGERINRGAAKDDEW